MTLYNEIEPFACQWLRALCTAGAITNGRIDGRSIEDLVPTELLPYKRVHLFAGIGVWDYALVNGGWDAEESVWTCSCPCQPFSTAGKGGGFSDERHLWPAAYHLISECRPDTVFGEQVASPNGYSWLDLVQDDMEGTGYTFGAVVTPAAGYGAPHGRHRIYWVAHTASRCEGDGQLQRGGQHGLQSQSGAVGGLDNPTDPRPYATTHRGLLGTEASGTQERGRDGWRSTGSGGPTNGFWSIADWLPCTDELSRPTQPGLFPLAHGVTGRLELLRGYGNALCAPQAVEFVRSFLEVRTVGLSQTAKG